MKTNFIRFLAMIAILAMLFGTTAFAENPYQDSFYEIPSVGIIATQKKGEQVMSSPESDSESIGSLDPGTLFRILGRYSRKWYLVDLTPFDEFEAEYGFINANRVVENPSWVMIPVSRPRQKEITWPVSSSSYAIGLIPILEEGEESYRSITRDTFSYTMGEKNKIKQFSEEGQELYFTPFDTPLFDDSQTETGELPGFTIVEITGETVDNYIPIRANPGKEDEFSGWIMNQTLLSIIN